MRIQITNEAMELICRTTDALKTFESTELYPTGLPEDGGEAESEGTCGGASDHQARMNEVVRRQTHSYTVNLNNTSLGLSPCLDGGQKLPPKYIF